MKRILISISFLIAAIFSVSAQDIPLWLRSNSISPDGTKIAFTYKGNIYIVSSEGGRAMQLTSNPAYDTTPIWTRDGSKIVFCSTREMSKDIFIVEADGGIPRRVTTHPGNESLKTVLEDGSIIFSAAINQDATYGDFPGNAQLYKVRPEGGRPEHVTSLPISAISVSEGSRTYVLYEDYKGYEDPFRKHHTSSVTRDIWKYTPTEQGFRSINGNGEFVKLSSYEGEDRNPVFIPGTAEYYYLSEKDGTMNIYAASVEDAGKNVQLTFHKTNPVRYLSVADDGTVCYSYDGELYTLKPGRQPEKVNISIVTDQVERKLQPQSLSSGATRIAVSPNGKEVAFVVRGDVYVTSVDHNTTRRITDTPEQERGLTFSKDGRTLYYASERNGHWGIWETSLTEKDDKYFAYSIKMEEKLLTKPGQTCFQPQVSPDGEWIAYLKDRTQIFIMNLKSGEEKSLLPDGTNYSYSDGDQSYMWGPDSKHILCNYQADGGWNNEDVALIDIETGEITDLTQSGYTDSNFRWALNGKAMTWHSDKGGYRSHGSWGAETDVYIMFFDREEYMNFVKDKEDRELAEMSKDEKDRKKEAKDSIKAEKKNEKLILELADRQNMIVKLTPYAGRLSDHYLTQDGKKLYYMVRLEKGTDLCVLNLEDRSIKVVSKGVSGSLYPTPDDKFMYMLSGGGISKISTADGSRKFISFTGEFDYKPEKEREYIFNHIWKQVKDKFYMTDIHGVDWEGYKDIYSKFLPHIDNNFDFQEMLSEMLGELNGSHTGARYSYRPSFSMARLGAIYDSEYEGDGLRIKEIIKGGPLFIQHPEVEAGDIIEAVDGKKIMAGDDWFHLFQNKAGKKVVLTISKGGKKSQDIYIKTGSSDSRTMYERWVAQRAEMVEKLSDGRIGYVHVEGMDSESFRRVYSDLLGKYRTCEAVIVDTRHNGGGWLHDDLATLLDGTGYIRFEPRGQYIGTEPYNKWTKPSCVLIGEDNYSDACGFPYVYKTLGIGKLIGAPVPGTMTAVWWETQIDPSLVFGIPQVGAIGVKEGRYLENMQIDPDILVYNDPASVLRGEDRQLEAAVAEMLKEIDNK